MSNKAIPISVIGTCSFGQSEPIISRKCEDTITLTVQWKNMNSNNLGIAI